MSGWPGWLVDTLRVLSALAPTASAVAAFMLILAMSADRKEKLRPRLVPMFRYSGNGFDEGRIFVENVGTGHALEIVARLTLEPGGMKTDWTGSSLAPGERRYWTPSMEGGEGKPDYRFQPKAHPVRTHVRLAGKCRDVSGAVHSVNELTPLKDDWHITAFVDTPEAQAAVKD